MKELATFAALCSGRSVNDRFSELKTLNRSAYTLIVRPPNVKPFVTRRSALKNLPARSSTLPSALTTKPLRCEFTGAGVHPFGFNARMAATSPRTAKTLSMLTPSHRRSTMLVWPSPLMSNPAVGVYGRAEANCTIGDTCRPSGRSMTPLPTIRCRSSRRVGPHSLSRNCSSGVMAMPLPLYDAVGWPPQAREFAST